MRVKLSVTKIALLCGFLSCVLSCVVWVLPAYDAFAFMIERKDKTADELRQLKSTLKLLRLEKSGVDAPELVSLPTQALIDWMTQHVSKAGLAIQRMELLTKTQEHDLLVSTIHLEIQGNFAAWFHWLGQLKASQLLWRFALLSISQQKDLPKYQMELAVAEHPSVSSHHSLLETAIKIPPGSSPFKDQGALNPVGIQFLGTLQQGQTRNYALIQQSNGAVRLLGVKDWLDVKTQVQEIGKHHLQLVRNEQTFIWPQGE